MLGPVDEPPQLLGLGDGLGRVAREARGDLDRHPPVDAVGAVVGGAEHVGGPADVVGGDHPGGLADADAAERQVLDLLVVGVALGERVGEDRRVGRHPDHVEVIHQGRQVAGAQPLPADVVQPDRYPRPG